jgi:hypothetical protein
MSKKRQTRNTKKMQKALGSKRSRAGYRVGGAIKEDARVSNPPQKPVLTNQEIGTVSNNRLKSSLISEFQQPIAKAPQESITKGVPFPRTSPVEIKSEPLTSVITKPTMPPTKEFKEMLSTLKDTGEREKYDQLFRMDPDAVFLQGGTESVRATENAAQSSSNPRIQEQTQSLPGDFNFRIPGNNSFMPGAAPPKKTEAPIGFNPGRPDAVELPQVTVEKVEEGPTSTTMQMDAVAPATAGTAETTDAVATTTGPVAKASVPQDVGASTMQAATVAALPEGQAAQGTISPEAIASVEKGTITSPAVAAQRDIASEQAAKAVAAQSCSDYFRPRSQRAKRYCNRRRRKPRRYSRV